MTVEELHISFKQGLDKFDSKNYPDLLESEIDLILTQAQEAWVKQRYGYSNVKRESFEETTKRTDELRTLVTSVILGVQTNSVNNIDSNSVFADALPSDYWLSIQEQSEIEYLDCNSTTVNKRVFTEAIQHDDYNKIINNPFAKPNKDKVLRLSSDQGVELLHDSSVTVKNYILRYLKRPDPIDLVNNPNRAVSLPEMAHQEIVNSAISIALENIESNRVSSYIQVTENREE